MKHKKLAILGGGNMGGAIARSLAGTDYEVTVTAASSLTLQRLSGENPDISTTLSNKEAVRDAGIVILAVKPYILHSLIEEIREHVASGAVIISVVAAVTIKELAALFNRSLHDLHIFRVIPNTAISLGKSATFIASAPEIPDVLRREVMAIFNRSGKTFEVPEKDMGAVTALSSCGIAYFLRFIRAASEGSVEIGLRPRFAAEVAAATAEGAGALIAAGGHPEEEIDKVTTPGGLTIKGLNALEANGFTKAVIEAIKASYK